MASINKVIILGNLGADPELRYTPGGAAVATLSVATSDVRVDKEGNRQESTEWHRIIVWNKQAENCAKYLAKGRTVFVEGRIQTRSWDDKQSGQKRYATEIIAQNVQFVGGAREGSQPRDISAYRDNNQSQQGGGYGGSQNAGMTDAFEPSSNYGGFSGSSLDDIPF